MNETIQLALLPEETLHLQAGKAPLLVKAGDEGQVDPVPTAPSGPMTTGSSQRKRSVKNKLHRWTRTIHVYTSLFFFVVVLFFAVTGLTLNHPSWVLGGNGSRETVKGVLPADWKSENTVDWLRTAEFLRSTHSLRGAVGDHDTDDRSGSITFKGPGYSADAFFDTQTGAYDLTIEAQGALAVMNDLHKGRHASSLWKWLIDVSAVLLIVISASGLALQFFLRKRRTSALGSAVIGGIAALVLTFMALS
jgi:uncharacterized protein